MEIQGAALIGTDRPARARAARLIARAAARAGLALDVVEFDHRLRLAASAFVAGLGDPGSATSELEDLARAAVTAERPTALLDDLRWRTWAAHTMGTAFVVCPDAPPEAGSALETMGFATIELPDTSAVGGIHDDERLWRYIAPQLERAGLSLPEEAPVGPGATQLDRQAQLRSYAARAGEVVVERFVRGLHHTGAAIVDASGRYWLGLSVEGTHGTTACAEAVALAGAVLDGADELTYVVAVRHPLAPGFGGRGYTVVSPCATCREALLDIAPDLEVVIGDGVALDAASVASLAAPAS